jgi:hypothetical protein
LWIVVVSLKAVAWTAVLSNWLSVRIISAVEGEMGAYSPNAGSLSSWTLGVVWMAMVSGKAVAVADSRISSMEGLLGLGDKRMLSMCGGEWHAS